MEAELSKLRMRIPDLQPCRWLVKSEFFRKVGAVVMESSSTDWGIFLEIRRGEGRKEKSGEKSWKAIFGRNAM